MTEKIETLSSGDTSHLDVVRRARIVIFRLPPSSNIFLIPIPFKNV
jgi:hypothetical protein